MAEFEIVKAYRGGNDSFLIPFTAPRGLAIMVDSADPAKGKLADGGFVGFLTRDVTTAGPALADHIYPGRLELPVKVGQECSVEKADAIEAEGAIFLMTSGTGALSDSTAVGTELSFKDGRLRVKQSGDSAYYRLAAQLTPETVGQARILAEAIR